MGREPGPFCFAEEAINKEPGPLFRKKMGWNCVSAWLVQHGWFCWMAGTSKAATFYTVGEYIADVSFIWTCSKEGRARKVVACARLRQWQEGL